MADRSAQTEEPTQRKLEKARKEGQFPQAKEFVSALQFLLLLGLASVGGVAWATGLREMARRILTRAFTGEIGVSDLISIAWLVCRAVLVPLAIAGAAVTGATLS